MNFETLMALTGFVLALGISSERVVEVIKNLVPFLNNAQCNTASEGLRKAVLQVLGGVAGVALAFLAAPILSLIVKLDADTGMRIAMGLLASGVAGFWNAVLGYVMNLKDLKRQQACALSASEMPVRVKEKGMAREVLG